MTAAPAPHRINATDRLAVTLFAAAALHLLLILGVSFTRQDPSPRNAPPLAMEITLVQSKQKEKPKAADYLAQANQAGGGNVQERLRPSSPYANPLPNDQRGDAPSTQLVTASPQRPTPQERKLITTEHASDNRVTSVAMQQQSVMPESLIAEEIMMRSREIARIEAELRERQQQYARMPQQKWIHANTQEYRFAAYEDAWRVKVERIGNLNYPEEAKRKQLSGHLLLDVALNPDGSLYKVEVVRSSGSKLLDDGAVRIVQLSAPFAPFPPDIRKDTDILHIVRTWQFQSDYSLRAR